MKVHHGLLVLRLWTWDLLSMHTWAYYYNMGKANRSIMNDQRDKRGVLFILIMIMSVLCLLSYCCCMLLL